jgi:hypothetical protein
MSDVLGILEALWQKLTPARHPVGMFLSGLNRNSSQAGSECRDGLVSQDRPMQLPYRKRIQLQIDHSVPASRLAVMR